MRKEVNIPNNLTHLNATSVMTRTKISIIDHFPRQSSHKRMDPRRETDNFVGGKNHNTKVISCFVYGQITEKMRIIIASSRPPAFQMSIVDLAIENSKN